MVSEVYRIKQVPTPSHERGLEHKRFRKRHHILHWVFDKSRPHYLYRNVALLSFKLANLTNFSLTTASIQSRSSFWTVLDVPLNIVALSRCSFSALSSEATTSTKPRNIPGLSEFSLSSLPRRANSNAPQKFTQSIILERMCLFFLPSSLCFSNANSVPFVELLCYTQSSKEA